MIIIHDLGETDSPNKQTIGPTQLECLLELYYVFTTSLHDVPCSSAI